MKKHLNYFLLFFALNFGIGQAFSQRADSLFRRFQVSSKLEDAARRDSLSIMDYAAYARYRINEDDPASQLLLDSLQELTSNSSWPKAFGIYMHVQARFFDRQGDMDSALNFYNLASDSLRKAGPGYQDLSMALIGSGFVLLNTQLYSEAFHTLQEGYQFAKASGHLYNQIMALNFFGDYYYYSAFLQENFDSALHYYIQTDSLIKANNITGYFKSDNELGLADVYRRLGKEELSEEHFQNSLSEAEKNKNYGVIYALFVDKAEIFEEKGQYQKALDLKLEAYKYVQASGWLEFIARADQHLYTVYKSLGDYENALSFYEKYIATQDSMKKAAATTRYADLEAKYESKEKEEEIVRLQNKNLQQTRNYLFWLILVGALFIGFTSWLNWRLRKKNTELKKKNQEILLAQLRGQNLERKRMAVELHDNLNTKIATIRWQLEAISPAANEKTKKILNKTLELVNDVYGDVRLISHNLMPEKVEALGLIPTLEGLLTQLNQNNKVKFNLVVNLGQDFDFGSLTYHIYNIIMEMINNILKHAGAANGWISISEEGDKILLTVSDDGRGFDIGQMTNGYGIRNITSRLENIRGKWNIDSAPGKGTKFFIQIPRLD